MHDILFVKLRDVGVCVHIEFLVEEGEGRIGRQLLSGTVIAGALLAQEQTQKLSSIEN